jgi:hypothetical protein
VMWQEMYTVTVFRSATFTAANADDAIDSARDYDIADRYVIRDSIDNGNYDFIEVVEDSFEANEE